MERTNPQAWEDGDPGPMKPSERLNAMRNADWRDGDALRPMTFDQLERAERVVRDGGGGPMFSEHETYADFHFGTDIPTGVVGEVQSSDGMSVADQDFAEMDARPHSTAVLWLLAALVVVLALAAALMVLA